MNATRLTNVAAAAILFAGAGMAHAGGIDCAVAAMVAAEGDHQVRVQVRAGDPDVIVHDDARTLEVRMENDDIHVRLNGEDISDDRIIREEGKIVIVGEDGEEIESIYVGLPDSGRGMWKMLRLDDGIFSPDSLGGGVARVEAGPEPRVMLGIHLEEPDAALCRHLRLEQGTATMVSAIYEGLAAHRAGLEQYDVISEIDGAAPADPMTLRGALDKLEPGGQIVLTVIHEGEPKAVVVSVDAWDREAMAKANLIGDAPIKARMFFKGAEGAESGELRWEDFPQHLHNLFLDKDNQLFEALHGAHGAGDPGANDDSDAENAADDRLERLNQRIEELEQMLDRVLNEAKEK